jgi:tetratricopeptide (TPR) repeat protein
MENYPNVLPYMAKFWIFILAIFWLGALPQATAHSVAEPPQILELADKLAEGRSYLQYQLAFELYQQAPRLHPQSYQAHWKAARAYYYAGTLAKRSKPQGWEDLCAKYGEKGMEHAQKATELKSQGVEGHFYYGLCAGVYSKGVSLVTAAVKGIRATAQKHLQKAYKLDKTYKSGIPILALGRYWEVLPMVAGQDLDKALVYYQEARRIMPQDAQHRPELNLYMGNLLLKLGRKKDQARELLQQAARSEHPYFSRQARELLQKEGCS